MATTTRYSDDLSLRVVMSGWINDNFIWSSVGGKVYAERYIRTALGWRSWTKVPASAIHLAVIFQGRLTQQNPAYASFREQYANRDEIEISFWSFGAGVKIDMVGGDLAPGGLLPNPSPSPNNPGVAVRAIRVNGAATVDGIGLSCPEITLGPFTPPPL